MGLFKLALGVFGFISNLKWIFAIIALAIGLGVIGSCSFKDKIHSTYVQHQMRSNTKKSAKNLVKSQKKSDSIERHIRQGQAQADRVREAAHERIVKQQERIQHEVDTQTPTDFNVPHPDYKLDLGTVRLLNAARQGTPVESAGSSDAALDAPSDVGVDKLVDNDLQVVKQYHELATRHDALVDFVEGKMREQAHNQ